MATVNAINHKRQNPGTMGRVIQYVMRDDKAMHHGQRLVSGQDCSSDTAFVEFMTTKQMHRKTDGRGFYHFVQSFHPDESITPDQAHDIAVELAKQFDGFEVLVATHVDAEHLHSHLIVNSVSYITGKKLHQSREGLMQLRQKSDEICLAHGLSVLPQREQKPDAESIRPREYRAALKGDSWKFRLMNAIDFCMARSRRRQDFVAEMKELGYEVAWTAGRKSITYTCPNGMKCRDKRLHDEKYLKKNMEVEFELRATQITEPTRDIQAGQALSAGGLRRTGGAVGGNSHAIAGESASSTGDGSGTESVRQRTLPRPDVAVDSDTAVLAGETDWEAARRELEAFERAGGLTAQIAGADTQAAPSLDAGGLGIAGSVGRLAGNLGEIIAEPEYKPQPQIVHEHKLGIGQKQDDHSGWQQEQSY